MKYIHKLTLAIAGLSCCVGAFAQKRTITNLNSVVKTAIPMKEKTHALRMYNETELANSVLVFDAEYFAMQKLRKDLLDGVGEAAFAYAFSPAMAESKEFKPLAELLLDLAKSKRLPILAGTSATYQSLASRSYLVSELNAFLKSHVPELCNDSLLYPLASLLMHQKLSTPAQVAAYEKSQTALLEALKVLPTLYTNKKSAAMAWTSVLTGIDAARKNSEAATHAMDAVLPQVFADKNMIYFGDMPTTLTPIQHALTSVSLPSKGTLVDAVSKKPIPFARLEVKNYSNRTLSDAAGNYSITLPIQLSDEIIEISAPGYAPKSISILQYLTTDTLGAITLTPQAATMVTDEKGKPMDSKSLYRQVLKRLPKNHQAATPQYAQYFYRHTQNNTSLMASIEGYKPNDMVAVPEALAYHQNLRITAISEGNEPLRNAIPAQLQQLLAQDVAANSGSVLGAFQDNKSITSATQMPWGDKSVYILRYVANTPSNYGEGAQKVTGAIYVNAEDFAVMRHTDTVSFAGSVQTSMSEYRKMDDTYALFYAQNTSTATGKPDNVVEWLLTDMRTNNVTPFYSKAEKMDTTKFPVFSSDDYWKFVEPIISRIQR